MAHGRGKKCRALDARHQTGPGDIKFLTRQTWHQAPQVGDGSESGCRAHFYSTARQRIKY